MILGCILTKTSRKIEPGMSSLLAVCDQVQPIFDHSKKLWERPEYLMRQEYVDYAIESHADWAVCLDDDEQFSDPLLFRSILKKLDDDVKCVQLVHLDLWDDKCRWRYPWNGQPQYFPFAWRPCAGQLIEKKPLHCGRAPASVFHEGKVHNVPFEICHVIHHGYKLRGDRIEKEARWREIDPNGSMCACNYNVYWSNVYVEDYPVKG